MRNQAVFLDRDGTINVEMKGKHSVKKFHLIPGTEKALGRLEAKCYKLIVVTNQAGLGYGNQTQKSYDLITDHMIEMLIFEGASLDAVIHCPHTVEKGCECRKPKIGMLEEAARRFNLDLSESWMIGDKTVDIETGKRAGCKTILVRTGHGGSDLEYSTTPDYTSADLLEAAKIICRNGTKNDLTNSFIYGTNAPRLSQKIR